MKNATNNCTILCQYEDKSFFSDIGICSIDCRNEEINKFIYDDKCVAKCPSNIPYENVIYNLCTHNCFAYDFFLKKCKMFSDNLDIREQLIKQIENNIINGLLDEMIKSIYENDEDFVIQEEDISYQLLSTNTKNIHYNISSVKLINCENKLRGHYNISNNSSLLMFKIDYIVPDILIPIVEYQVFHPETKELLDLNICNDTNIAISYPILKDIDSNNIFIHDPNDKFYNDKCYPYKVNGADIILNDRKKI